MTIWLVHGFNVSDGGARSVGTLGPHLWAERVRVFDYGWTGVVRLRSNNKAAVRNLANRIEKGDILIGHSNGALVCWEVAQRVGHLLGGVVTFNAAMRRDTQWPKDLPVLAFANSTDVAVQFGRAWSRLVSLGGVSAHGWGAAGRYGFTAHQSNVENIDMHSEWWGVPVKGHSGQWKGDAPEYWAGHVNAWVSRVVDA